MRKLIITALCAIVFASAYAEQLDHWEIDGGSMTDGVWTFTVSRRVAMDPIGDNVYQLWVQGCTGYPSSVSTLDFSKPLVNLTSGDSQNYAITQIDTKFGDSNGSSTEEGQMIGVLKFPTHEYGFGMSACFAQCANLVEVVPFLPSTCKSVSRGCFQNCTSLALPLKYSGSADFNGIWEIFKNTPIPSVDLSESTITTLDRECFSGCASLKTIKLPPTLTTLQGGIQSFNNCTSLELVEFNSVPGNLSAFNGCTSLKEVRFCHCAPTVTISAGIYNQLNQDITTYLILDDEEYDELAAWAALTAGGELSDDATWAQTYAGSAALMAKRPLLRFSVKHISLAAGQDGGVIAGRPGTFIVSRAEGDPLGGSVMVNYEISGGTAEEGVHFEPLTGLVAIPSGEKSGVIEVSPKYFAYIGTETLTIKLAAGDYEIVEGEDEATISLSTEALRSVSIAKGEDADEGTGAVGSFILSRGEADSVEGPVEVLLSFGGTAVNGQTYRPIGSSVIIPAGEKTLKVKVVPYEDQSVTEDSVAEVTIQPGGYGIGTAASTSVAIKNGATYGGWKFVDGNHISDGEWTFTVARRPDSAEYRFEDGTRHLWVQNCTGCPLEVSTLDFGKAFHNFYDNTYYAFSQFENTFLNNADAATALGSLILPDDPGHKYKIFSGCFKGCPNLTSVTPFLPKTCDLLGQNAFGSLPNLVQKDLYFYGSDFGNAIGCWGIIESSSGITNVDLSASTITVLRRDCFKNCTGLKVVKLPPTIEEFGAPYVPEEQLGLNNRTPFNGVGGVKLVFTGGALPVMTYQDGNVAAIEFKSPVAELPDNAFANYYSIHSSPCLSSITFVGPPPATIGSDLFTGGYKDRSITVNVPAYYIADWRKIADDGKLTIKDGGTWTSGTTQILAPYGDPRGGMLIIVR